MARNELVGPVVKWAGGKRQLLPEIRRLLPERFSAYFEPFVGGGAVLFNLKPQRAIINDANSELINVYRVIKDDVDGLIADLKKHKNEPKYFYGLRGLDRDKERYALLSDTERASRIIYLNKTCYNGLFRVNKKGQFNTPFGAYQNPNIVNENTLRAVHQYFNESSIEFLNVDFSEAVLQAKDDDFVYLDPPYDPLSASANFTSYHKGGFGADEQLRLKKLCDELSRRGAMFMLSNSATDLILNLYAGYDVRVVRAKRVVNSKCDKRGKVEEVLVTNYQIPGE